MASKVHTPAPQPKPPSLLLLLQRQRRADLPYQLCSGRPQHCLAAAKDLEARPREAMSRNNWNGPRPEMRLNASPPGSMGGPSSRAVGNNSPHRKSSSSSSPSSCVSSEAEQGSNSPEATSMVLAACPRCLMYVMLVEDDPRCPKCRSTVLLDFLQGSNATKKTRKT